MSHATPTERELRVLKPVIDTMLKSMTQADVSRVTGISRNSVSHLSRWKEPIYMWDNMPIHEAFPNVTETVAKGIARCLSRFHIFSRKELIDKVESGALFTMWGDGYMPTPASFKCVFIAYNHLKKMV